MIKLGAKGVHGVRFNEGGYSCFSPMKQLKPIYEFIKKNGYLDATASERRRSAREKRRRARRGVGSG